MYHKPQPDPPSNIKFLTRLYGNGQVALNFMDEEDARMLLVYKVIPVADNSVPDEMRVLKVFVTEKGGNIILVNADNLNVYHIYIHVKYNVATLGLCKCATCFRPLTFAERMTICERCNEVVDNALAMEKDEPNYIDVTLNARTVTGWVKLKDIKP